MEVRKSCIKFESKWEKAWVKERREESWTTRWGIVKNNEKCSIPCRNFGHWLQQMYEICTEKSNYDSIIAFGALFWKHKSVDLK